jgi:hypothetical protein
MMNYRKLNNISGWLVFAISTLVYMLTVEPTASWWDCGEYIATAYKLQVGHPPGAPLFQMLGRFFSLFAFGDVTKVALMINVMSALCSSFTILFLFWSITMLAKKIVMKAVSTAIGMTESKMFAVIGSGAVGALAYTFSDSFWFSAVEGEVYAMSSFFTALVFWAILKWEDDAEDKHNLRWLILIAYLMGLSIGVHLLNLLAIPAIAYVYYFKKFEVSRKGIIYTGILSMLFLVTIMYIVIPGILKVSSLFELFFVNNIGLPFNTGTIFYFILLLGLLIYGIRYSIRKHKLILNTFILCFVFILIGYSSFFMLIIRSNADVPIDENSPEESISMLSYLNREQYGNWPLLKGQYYNAPLIEQKEGSPVYFKDKKKGKYTIVRRNIENIYDEKFQTIFPRMWSNRDSKHITKYKEYVKGIPVRVTTRDGNSKVVIKPTFADNLKFFMKYQVGHMYFRYFMWNFAGRQNNIESQGDPRYGNWISGINFIDDYRLGNISGLSDSFKNNATNKFYLLPLILGLLGAFFQFKKHKNDSWVVLLLFLMTGLAIVVYLNQYPFQPRERDYAYAGSFYAFAIWIGLGVLALVNFLSKYTGEKKIISIGIIVICLILIPGIMGSEGWDDHDRSGKTAARDFAKNYLTPLPPNSVIYTIGDNDTFPLWYVQEVENFRTDVRVVNYMLSSGEWYVLQLSKKAYEAEPLPFSISPENYDKGKNDITPYYEVNFKDVTEHIELKDMIDFIASEDARTKLPLQNGKRINFFPSKKVKITVDSAACVDNGIVPRELAHLIVPEIVWEIKTDELMKNDLAFLDFMANNNWTRNVYFSNPSVVSKVFDVDEFIHLEGTVYRFMPIKADDVYPGLGGINSDRSYDILMNETQWGNLNNPNVNVDRESERNSSISKQSFMRVASALVNKGKNKKAIKLLDHCFDLFPHDKFLIDRYTIPYVEIYYKAGALDKADDLSMLIVDRYLKDIDYYMTFGDSWKGLFNEELTESIYVIQALEKLGNKYKRDDLVNKIDTMLKGKMKYFQ